MGMEKHSEFDIAKHLCTEELQHMFLEEVAITAVAKAMGMEKMVRDSGLSRKELSKVFSSNEAPSFLTVCKIMKALGYAFKLVPIAKTEG